MPQVINTAKTMVQAAEIFDIPLVVTEQYPKALGHTVTEIDLANKKECDSSCIQRMQVFEKTRFSMCTDEVFAHLQLDGMKGRKSAVLFGVETHVCVQQTALDLLARNYTVHVLADGVSSQRAIDREVAIERLRQSGAFITTSESVLFELLREKDAPQ